MQHIVEKFNQMKVSHRSSQIRTYQGRLEALEKLGSAIEKNLDEIHKALNLDLGKSEIEAYTAETSFLLGEIKKTKKSLKKWIRPKSVKAPLFLMPSKSYIVPEPLGTCLIIGPWNYPFQLVLSPLIGALAAGNNALLKPSEVSPHTSEVIKKIIEENFDSTIVSVVQGGVEETTTLLELNFDKIFYTGNPHVGKIVMRKAAENLTPVTLELGGKSPCFVWDCHNLEVTARRVVWGKFYNCGQTCVAPDYVVIHKNQKNEFVEKLKKYIDLFYGQDSLQSPDYGKIINQRHFKRLKGLLDETQDNILYGGDFNEKECFISPTLVDSHIDSKLMEDEIFGPILPILTFDTVEEGLNYVHEGQKPLASYLFTTNNSLKKKFSENISSGGMCINDVVMHLANHNLPFGGVGHSGMGRYHGHYSFKEFSHEKAVMKRSFQLDLDLRYPPFNERKKSLLKTFLEYFS